MRHKDANLHLAKKRFQKAAQNPAGGCHGICLSRTKVNILRPDRSLLMRHTRMQTCTWPRSAALASKKQLRNLSEAIRRMYIWLSRKMDTGALLMRHKDANLRLTKKCGAGFHKAGQYQPDVMVFVQLMRHKDASLRLTKHLRLELSMRHKDANLHLTKCGTGFQKAALYPPYLSMETSLHI